MWGGVGVCSPKAAWISTNDLRVAEIAEGDLSDAVNPNQIHAVS